MAGPELFVITEFDCTRKTKQFFFSHFFSYNIIFRLRIISLNLIYPTNFFLPGGVPQFLNNKGEKHISVSTAKLFIPMGILFLPVVNFTYIL
jgi:hypothetical protein